MGERHYGKSEVAIYAATALAVVVTNLLEGIVIGLALALAKQLWILSHLDVRMVRDEARSSTQLLLAGAGTFVSLPRLAETLERVPAGDALTIDMSRLRHVDHAFMEALSGFERDHAATGGTCQLDWDGLHALQVAGRPSSLQAAAR